MRALILATFCVAPLYAGGSSENALLIVDPSSAEALRVANHYLEKRDLPRSNVLYMAPLPSQYAQFKNLQGPAFLGMLDQLGIADHIDYVILPSGAQFYLSSSGTISDACAPVNRFSATAPYVLARQSATLSTNLDSSYPNQYYSSTQDARGFDAQQGYLGGLPSSSGQRYFLAALLGYTGPNGNTLDEVLAMIDRSVAVDGTQPNGNFYFMQTNDLARSGPRHGAYPGVSAAIQALGGSAQHLFADLPLGNNDCMGVMTGLATPDIQNPAFQLLPGAFADHLTSFAATFEDSSQTKMSRWITKGASGTSGTVEEPCNYAGKFPHARLHLYYRKGLSLGEAWLRSLAFAPLQQLFTGDPLTRPYAQAPSLALSGMSATASGWITPQPSGSASAALAQMARYELLIDGRLVSSVAPGSSFLVDTSVWSDGWHEWRLVGWDNSLQRHSARLVGSVVFNNLGRSASLSSALTSGELSTRIDLNLNASGSTPTQLRVWQGSRIVATRNTPGVVSVYGHQLGAGKSRLHLEAVFSDGRSAQSAPIELNVAPTAGSPDAIAPIAHSYSRRLRRDRSFVLELPASFNAPSSSATYTWLSLPSQASLLPGQANSQAWLAFEPQASASGTDTLQFQVSTAAGQSNLATIQLEWLPDPCPAPQSECVPSPNTTGVPAVLSSFGSQSYGANSLGLLASQCPPNKTGIFLYSKLGAQAPLGDGVLCLSNPISRLAVVSTDPFGEVVLPLDFSSGFFVNGVNALHPGETARFQLWYRDPGLGLVGNNLSNGWAITLCQ